MRSPLLVPLFLLGLCLLAEIATATRLRKGARRAQQATKERQTQRHALPDAPLPFDYSHWGQDWVQGQCGSRERQSPINFDDLTTPPNGGDFAFNYQLIKQNFPIRNDKQTLHAIFDEMGYGGLTVHNAWYRLVAIDFHSLSEHTFQQEHFPMEMHIVHQRDDSEPEGPPFVTIALMFESPKHKITMVEKSFPPGEGDAKTEKKSGPPEAGAPGFNPVLQNFLKGKLPGYGNMTAAPIDILNPMDLNPLLTGGTYLNYLGSTTSPPCSEDVAWYVRREPLEASDEQLERIYDVLSTTTAGRGNYRSVMPMNGRPVSVVTVVNGEPAPTADVYKVPVGENPRTYREHRAVDWSMQALRTGEQAMEAVRALDVRLHDGAKAHMDKMMPDLTPDWAKAQPAPAPAPMDIGKLQERMQKEIGKYANQQVHEAWQGLKADVAPMPKQAARDIYDAAVDEVDPAYNGAFTPPPPVLAVDAPAAAPSGAPAGAPSMVVPQGATQSDVPALPISNSQAPTALPWNQP